MRLFYSVSLIVCVHYVFYDYRLFDVNFNACTAAEIARLVGILLHSRSEGP